MLNFNCSVSREMNMREINGYGQQEIVAAKELNRAVLLQLDANAKVGRTVISSDPKCPKMADSC